MANTEAIDLALLRALGALVKERSVSAAARRLGTSQPAMSRALARLRAVLGDEVMVRTKAGMSPTPRALEASRELGAALEQIGSALRPPRFDPETAERRFSLMSWDYTERIVLPPLLGMSARRAPRISVDAQRLTERAPAELLESGQVDLIVGLHRELGPGYFRKRLFQDRFVCILRRSKRAAPLDLEAFLARGHLLVAPFGPARGVVDMALEALGRRRRVSAYVPNFLVAPEIIAESDLVATVPRRLALAAARGLPLTVIEPPLALPRFTVEAVWHERTHKDPGHVWFRSLAFEAARAL